MKRLLELPPGLSGANGAHEAADRGRSKARALSQWARADSSCVSRKDVTAYPIYDLWPTFPIFLSKERGRRIPWAVIAVFKPTPVGIFRQQDPDRLAHASGEVGDCRIDADHEIQASDKARSVVEVGGSSSAGT